MIIFPTTSIITSDYCQPNQQYDFYFYLNRVFFLSDSTAVQHTRNTTDPNFSSFMIDTIRRSPPQSHKQVHFTSQQDHTICAAYFPVQHATHLGEVEKQENFFFLCSTTVQPPRMDIAMSMFWSSLSDSTTSLNVYISMGPCDAIPAGQQSAARARSTLVSAESVLRRVFRFCQELFNFNLLFDFNDHWLVFNQIQLDCCNWAALHVDSTYSHDSRHGMIHSLDRNWLLRIAN